MTIKNSLSVIIITRNEAHNIENCLQSVLWADEIIVIDSGSSDHTVALAKKYTDKVYSTDWQGYGIQKQRALDYATGSWILSLDADEIVDDTLRKAIEIAIKDSIYSAYRIPIHLNFYNQELKYSWSPKNHIRLFQRAGASYNDNIVHEAIILPKEAKVGSIKPAIRHYCLQDITHALSKMNIYSSYSANMRLKKQRAPSLLKIILGSWWMFFRCYFIQRGFLEGRAGYILAVLSAQHSFYRGIKMHFIDRSVNE